MLTSSGEYFYDYNFQLMNLAWQFEFAWQFVHTWGMVEVGTG